VSDSFLPTREFLRHTLATVAYRGCKTLRDAPESFAGFKSADSSRTPVEILAHMGDLYEWSLSVARGAEKWHNSKPLEWDKEVQRFFAALKNFDDYLASEAPLRAPIERLFQGPIADSLTHIGQLAMLRRLAGSPIKGENYVVAEITAGRVGPDQAASRLEF
jgi:hypothetical protein